MMGEPENTGSVVVFVTSHESDTSLKIHFMKKIKDVKWKMF